MAIRESPNTLISNTRLKIIDLVSEGETALFWPVSGVSGSNPLCSVLFDDVPVMNGDGSVNWNISGQGFSFQYTSGASGQAPMVGFESVEAMIPLPFNTRITNPPITEGYPQSPTIVFNTTQYPDAQAVKVTVKFPAVYTVDTTNPNTLGNTDGFNITWAVDISLNNGPWVQTGLHNLTDFASAPKCTSPYYNTQIYTLPKTTPTASYYSWRLRVRRVTTTVLSTNTQNDMYLDNVAAISSFTYSYPKSALVGMEISADQFGTVPNRAYEVKGVKVLVPNGYTPTQYNVGDGTITAAVYPSVWNGTFSTTRFWTDNPAWIFYDLVTNRRYGLGNYIRPEWLDKWTLYQIARYCDEMVDDGDGGLEPRFTCNVAITQQQDAYTLLNNLVSVFQGMLYYANGRIFPVGPEIRDPVFNFTNSNVIGGSFSYSDTPRNTRSTVCVVKWTDPTNNYRPTPERIEDIDGIGKYGYIEKQITAFACTSRGQAIRSANWILTVEQLLTETVSFQTDLEGLYLRPGDVFNVYDNFRNNQQQGGRVTDIASTYVARDTIRLDRDVFLEPGFTYVMSALVPAANWATGQNITGSSQVGMIRNSQIETKTVVTPTSTTNSIIVSGSFSSGLYRGSVWILNGSGNSVTIFDQATQYKCLVAGEPRNGQVEVLGVKYQTGINYKVNNDYSSIVSPAIDGDTAAPLPPTGMVASIVSGVLNDNQFFRYLYLNWNPSASVNTSNYSVFGSFNSGSLFSIGRPTITGINYTPSSVGHYDFQVAAFNANGYGSAYTHTTYVETFTNPLGVTAPLSGIFISSDYDDQSRAPAGSTTPGQYTGFVGPTPTFSWVITREGNDVTVETATAQFISGYRVQLLKSTDTSVNLLYNDIYISGKNSTSFSISDGFLQTGTTLKALRSFVLAIDTVDNYGNIRSGARLPVKNLQPAPPVSSGFVGYNGGISYNITPAREDVVSGIYIWTNSSPSFVPTYKNTTYTSTNFAGFASSLISTGSFYTWFSIVDSFGPSGSISTLGDYNTPIYGPISGNANAIVGDLYVDITADLTAAYAAIDAAEAAASGAFGLLTGQITNMTNILSGQNQLTLQTVNGLSGQIMGTTQGDANTALNVRVNTITVSSSGALSQQINAVRALTELTGQALTSQVSTVSTALTNSGVALGSQITTVQANVNSLSGQSNARVDTVQIALASTGSSLAQDISIVRANLATTGSTLNASVINVSSALTASGVALGQQITTVQANVGSLSGQSNARIDTTQTALATTGGALSRVDQSIEAAISGVYSKIRIVADSFVTGSLPGGLDNAAKAVYGFKLDANGKVVSMVATSSTFPGEESTIKFGGASLQSDTFVAGSQGWRISAGGSAELAQASIRGDITGGGTLQSSNFVAGSAGWRILNAGTAEFADASIRGAFTGGGTMSSANYVAGSAGWQINNAGTAEFANASIRGAFTGGVGNYSTSIDNYGFVVGSRAAGPNLGVAVSPGAASERYLFGRNAADYLVFNAGVGPSSSVGFVTLANNVGTTTVDIQGGLGRATFAGTITTETQVSTKTLSVLTGSNLGSIPAGFAAGIINRDNFAYSHGLFVGSNYENAGSILFKAAHVHGGTAAVTDRFVVYGNGAVGCSGALTALGQLSVKGTSYLEDDVHIGTTSLNKWFYLDNVGAQLVIGADVNVYRGAANTLKTDDSLEVVGDCSAASFNTTSSRRYKKNIAPMRNALQTVNLLSGVTFDWNTKELSNDFGLIAEDVATVLPTAVAYDISGYAKGVDYGRLSAILIEAVKDLSQQVRDIREDRKYGF